MIGQLNLTFWALMESVRGMVRREVWFPFAVMFAIQAIVLLVLTQFYRPALSWFTVPVLNLMGGEQVMHYPQYFVALPALFSRANLAIDWLAGSLFFGLAFLLIWRAATGQPRGDAGRRTGRAYLKLLGLRLPAMAFLVFLYLGLPHLLPAESELRGNALRLYRYGTFSAGILAEAIFIYAPIALLVVGRSFGGSLRESLALVWRVPIATFLIVMIPNLLQLPLSAALRRSESLVRNLAPEMVGWLLLAGIVIYVVVNYLVIASAVRVFGARSASVEGGRTWAQ